MTTIQLDSGYSRTTGMAADLTDGELAVAAAGSVPGAWEALTARYGRTIAGIARRHRLSEADVADVTQTVWLRLVEHLDRLREPQHVGAWLKTTARNEALRVARQRQRTSPVEDFDALGLQDETSDRLSPVEVEERDSSVRALVAGLPRHERAILQLLMSDPQPSYREVSENLGIPVGSIGPTRQRSLRALRHRCLAVAI